MGHKGRAVSGPQIKEGGQVSGVVAGVGIPSLASACPPPQACEALGL